MDFLQKDDLLNETSLVSEDAKGNLATIAQWINISAIVSFVSLAISTLQLIIRFTKAKAGFYQKPGLGDIFTQVIIIAVSLLLSITLFNAAKYLKTGLVTSDQSYFNLGIRNLNSYFKIYGVLTIVMLVIFVLAFVGIFFAVVVGGYGK